jgi:hypothetical protein
VIYVVVEFVGRRFFPGSPTLGHLPEAYLTEACPTTSPSALELALELLFAECGVSSTQKERVSPVSPPYGCHAA